MPAPFYKAAQQRGNVRTASRQTSINANIQPKPFNLLNTDKHKYWNRHVKLPQSAYFQSASMHNDYTENPITGSTAMNCTDHNNNWRVCGQYGGVIDPVSPIPKLPLPRQTISGEPGTNSFVGGPAK